MSNTIFENRSDWFPFPEFQFSDRKIMAILISIFLSNERRQKKILSSYKWKENMHVFMIFSYGVSLSFEVARTY
jgi:hypothetical protein